MAHYRLGGFIPDLGRPNPAGTITGSYTPNYLYGPYSSFVRTPNGTLTTFDYPGSNQGTFPSGITPAGTITGSYYGNGQYHGFLRTRKGNFTTFDYPPSQGMASLGTTPFAINPAGEIAGWYYDAYLNRWRVGGFSSFEGWSPVSGTGQIGA